MSIQEAAWWMLSELREQRLEVVKINGLRVAVSQNPEWYRQLCETHAYRRRRRPKVRTIIKRMHVIRTLRSIVDEKQDMDTVYAQRLLPFIEDYCRAASS